jgi:alpha-tubulin suppressor-like RCC1 family protein
MGEGGNIPSQYKPCSHEEWARQQNLWVAEACGSGDGGALSTSKTFELTANLCLAPTVADGSRHQLTLRGDSTIWAWGLNGGSMHSCAPQMTQLLVPNPPSEVGCRVPYLNLLESTCTATCHHLARL